MKLNTTPLLGGAALLAVAALIGGCKRCCQLTILQGQRGDFAVNWRISAEPRSLTPKSAESRPFSRHNRLRLET
jgi:hypothetical protein